MRDEYLETAAVSVPEPAQRVRWVWQIFEVPGHTDRALELANPSLLTELDFGVYRNQHQSSAAYPRASQTPSEEASGFTEIRALRLRFVVLSPPNIPPTDEHWSFPRPGSITTSRLSNDAALIFPIEIGTRTRYKQLGPACQRWTVCAEELSFKLKTCSNARIIYSREPWPRTAKVRR